MLDPMAAGVWRLRLPMRFHPGHVNSYLIESENGWLVVDCGNHSEATRAVWRAFLDSDAAAPGVRAIFLTHAHPDHYGSAPWLARQTGAPVVMAEQEWDAVNRLWRGSVSEEAALRDFYRRWGASDADLDNVVMFMHGFRAGCPELETEPVLLAEGEGAWSELPGWQLLPGFGHTPRNLMPFRQSDGVLITGDQVLPGIVPNLSLWFASDRDPVASYLETLARIRDLPVCQALPAHGDPFDHFLSRCDSIAAVHHKRLQRLRDALSEGPLEHSALAKAVLGKVPQGPLFLLIAGQLYALVRFLENRGEVVRNGSRCAVPSHPLS